MSTRKKINQFYKIIFINISFLLLIFTFLEALSRIFYPEFNNAVHRSSEDKNKLNRSGITRGKIFYTGNLNGNTAIGRVPKKNGLVKSDKPLFIIIGDSITWGYGLSYEDIYWTKIQRKYNLDKNNIAPIKIIGLSASGNNLNNSDINLKNLISNNESIDIKKILYQFNYNDITPYKKKDLKEINNKKSFLLKFSNFRYRYLNKSTFLRILQFYSSSLTRKLSGNCSYRGLDALGPYTWSYGHKDFRNESLDLWNNFEIKLKKLNEIAKGKNASFSIFISPLVFDIDEKNLHPYINKNRYDFSCSTINPRERLFSIANKLEIEIIDPTNYLKTHFNKNNLEGNFKPFFFPGDENHFNNLASEYIADYLYFLIFHKIK